MKGESDEADSIVRKVNGLRLGWAKKHPVQDKSLESVRDVVREQWEQEQQVKPESKPMPPPDKGKQQKPPEPDRD